MHDKKYKRLTINERRTVEHALDQNQSLKSIGRELGRSTGTISREIHRNSFAKQSGCCGSPFNNCVHRNSCKERNLCSFEDCTEDSCARCKFCSSVCKKYEHDYCSRLDSHPYVCNGCSMIKRCTLEKFIYKATRAQRTAEEELAGARCGIAVSEQERLRISEIVSPLIKNGQSPYHICAMNKDALMISDKTLYKYIAANLLDVSSTDLARKVKMKPRRAKPQIKVERACREGRTYRDFENFMSENPDTAAVQMDSVIGSKGTGEKVLLTIHFPASHLMLAFLREANTARSVSEIFNMLKEKLGYEHFTELFPAILTDNGSEFSNPSAIETDEDGVVWTKIFYCDPNCPYQKPQIENNHTLIRKISPKGKSMNFMAQSDADSMMGQINSYARKSLGGKTPLTLFLKMYGKPIAKKLGLRAINTNDITLSPNLFK